MVVLQVKRNLGVLCKPAKSRHRRTASTLHDCLDAPPPQPGCSPWLLFIIVLVLLYYVYYCRIGDNYSAISRMETDERSRVPDEAQTDHDTSKIQPEAVPEEIIPVTRIALLPCGISGCDNQPVSKLQKKIKVSDFYRDSDNKMPCFIDMNGRGKLQWNSTETKVNLTRAQYPTVRLGGYYMPADCQSRHKVAIIVPYRDNEKTLNVFLYNMHPFLMSQKIEYRIFVIEQTGPDDLNKGSLLNAGYEQALRFGSWQCLVFHDPDLLPLDERILYTCPTYPRHMSATVLGQGNQAKYKLFGGVAAMTDKHFLQVNGYSNSYWGCRGADSDIYWRIRLMGYRVMRYDKKIAVYKKLEFQSPTSRDANFDEKGREVSHPGAHQSQFRSDGISTIHYKVMDIQQRLLYTHILVDLGPTPNYTVSGIW